MNNKIYKKLFVGFGFVSIVLILTLFVMSQTYIQNLVYHERLSQMEEVTHQMFRNLEDVIGNRWADVDVQCNYLIGTDLQTDTDRYFSTVSLAQLEKRLDGHGFFRVHRGYLVNLSMVDEVESVSGGTLLLTLNGVEDKIPVSRRRVSALKKALGL